MSVALREIAKSTCRNCGGEIWQQEATLNWYHRSSGDKPCRIVSFAEPPPQPATPPISANDGNDLLDALDVDQRGEGAREPAPRQPGQWLAEDYKKAEILDDAVHESCNAIDMAFVQRIGQHLPDDVLEEINDLLIARLKETVWARAGVVLATAVADSRMVPDSGGAGAGGGNVGEVADPGPLVEPASARAWLAEHVPLQFDGTDGAPVGCTMVRDDQLAQLMDEFASDLRQQLTAAQHRAEGAESRRDTYLQAVQDATRQIAALQSKLAQAEGERDEAQTEIDDAIATLHAKLDGLGCSKQEGENQSLWSVENRIEEALTRLRQQLAEAQAETKSAKDRMWETGHELDRYREALCFAASVIKSGESWTKQCEEIIGAALASDNSQPVPPTKEK